MTTAWLRCLPLVASRSVSSVSSSSVSYNGYKCRIRADPRRKCQAALLHTRVDQRRRTSAGRMRRIQRRISRTSNQNLIMQSWSLPPGLPAVTRHRRHPLNQLRHRRPRKATAVALRNTRNLNSATRTVERRGRRTRRRTTTRRTRRTRRTRKMMIRKRRETVALGSKSLTKLLFSSIPRRRNSAAGVTIFETRFVPRPVAESKFSHGSSPSRGKIRSSMTSLIPAVMTASMLSYTPRCMGSARAKSTASSPSGARRWLRRANA